MPSAVLAQMMNKGYASSPDGAVTYCKFGNILMWSFEKTQIYRCFFESSGFGFCTFECVRHDDDPYNSWLCHEDESIECETDHDVIVSGLGKLISSSNESRFDAFKLLMKLMENSHLHNNLMGLILEVIFKKGLDVIVGGGYPLADSVRITTGIVYHAMNYRRGYEDRIKPFIEELKARLPPSKYYHHKQSIKKVLFGLPEFEAL